jgi:2',3'-cyclic-nucleotide 2'-phosphodiesterase (5'-nucleotidase family)
MILLTAGKDFAGCPKWTDFPVLSANVPGHDGRKLLEPSTIKELGGIRIGIFGLTTPETCAKPIPVM